ncbi:MAG: hypothetical protein ACRCXL_06720 [Dermatophilaceae bacterium]
MDRPGTAADVYRRQVGADGRPVAGAVGQWEYDRLVCTQDAPAAEPVLTMAMIREAFRDTAFATASVVTSPPGGTLCNAPTWLHARVGNAGHGPQEVDTVTLVGVRVQIRPVFASVMYHLGAGASAGPMASLGGPYPDGDVIAAYRSPGGYPTRADITYTGQFRLPGGVWAGIPGEVTIPGALTTVRVWEARARLVSGDRPDEAAAPAAPGGSAGPGGPLRPPDVLTREDAVAFLDAW